MERSKQCPIQWLIGMSCGPQTLHCAALQSSSSGYLFPIILEQLLGQLTSIQRSLRSGDSISNRFWDQQNEEVIWGGKRGTVEAGDVQVYICYTQKQVKREQTACPLLSPGPRSPSRFRLHSPSVASLR